MYVRIYAIPMGLPMMMNNTPVVTSRGITKWHKPETYSKMGVWTDCTVELGIDKSYTYIYFLLVINLTKQYENIRSKGTLD